MRVTIFTKAQKPRYINVSGWEHARFELVKDKNKFDLAIFTDFEKNHFMITPENALRFDGTEKDLNERKKL